MSYNPNIPQNEISPSNSAVPMQTNFSQFQTAISENHVPLNNAGQGKHATVILQNQSADPGVTNSYDCLYAKDATSAVNTQSQLFLQIPQFLPNEQSNTPIQLTYNQVINSGVANPSSTQAYQSFMIGAYLIFMNQVTVPSATGVTVTLPIATTKLISVVAQSCDNTQTPWNYAVKILTATTFTINVFKPNPAGNILFSYIAIAQA